MYRYEFTPVARQKLRKLARYNPKLVEAIMRKIMWLAENAEDIAHRPIRAVNSIACTAGHTVFPICSTRGKN
jgi:mRNA-degrading endonuclease RelE of RelBE toxin-antitoxin system